MFVYTVKASRIKFFALLICSMAILLTLASVVPRADDLGSVAVVTHEYSNIVDNSDRIAFLEEFGYQVEETPIEVAEVEVPKKFDSVYEKYNDVQRAQGLNLKRYAGKTVTRYTYKIKNYSNAHGDVLANILIYKNSIVAGDVSCTGVNAFLHGFEKNTSN